MSMALGTVLNYRFWLLSVALYLQVLFSRFLEFSQKGINI